jgi:GTP-binding protein
VRPIVAIVGRPNVGKSTLFNRLLHENRALIDDRPGVTRDRLYGVATLRGREVIVIDTGGIDTDPAHPFAEGILKHVQRAMADADVVLFLTDGMAGLLPEDHEIFGQLRRSKVPVVVAVNKCESVVREATAGEAWSLGADVVVPIAAAHGRGIGDLEEAILDRLPEPPDDPSTELGAGDTAAEETGDGQPVIRVAVVGRPNVGKSTLVNRLLGEERCLVSEIAGTTRDAVDVDVRLGQRVYRFVDTAGLRRKAKISEHLERSSVFMAIRQIERADIVLLLVDPDEGVTNQDQQVASLVADARRPALVLANKWDLLPREKRESKDTMRDLREALRFLPDAPVLNTSGLTGRGLQRLAPTIDKLYDTFHKRVGTAALNRFLKESTDAAQPPSYRHHPMHLLYMTQVRTAPPTFVIFANFPEGIPESYKRYLSNRLREQQDFAGVPTVLFFRKRGDSPGGRGPHHHRATDGDPSTARGAGASKRPVRDESDPYGGDEG